MKKNLLALCSVIVMCCWGSYYQTHYERQAKVVSISNDIITVIDNVNYLWEFQGEGYHINDNVILHMHTNNTDNNIYDDIIERVTIIDTNN